MMVAAAAAVARSVDAVGTARTARLAAVAVAAVGEQVVVVAVITVLVVVGVAVHTAGGGVRKVVFAVVCCCSKSISSFARVVLPWPPSSHGLPLELCKHLGLDPLLAIRLVCVSLWGKAVRRKRGYNNQATHHSGCGTTYTRAERSASESM